MARYWVTSVGAQSGSPTSFGLNINCSFIGSDVQDGQYERQLAADILFTDTPAIIRTKMTDAVVAGATSVPNSSGQPGVTVVRGQGLIPTFQVGA